MNVKYEATIPANINADNSCNLKGERMVLFEYNERIGTVGTMAGCIVTRIFYGGWCWAYLALPWEEDYRRTKDEGLKKIKKLNNLPPNYDIEACVADEKMVRTSW